MLFSHGTCINNGATRNLIFGIITEDQKILSTNILILST